MVVSVTVLLSLLMGFVLDRVKQTRQYGEELREKVMFTFMRFIPLVRGD